MTANFLTEILPISARLELKRGRWVRTYFPPNMGGPRDIPAEATKHESIDMMIEHGILDGSMDPVLGGSSFRQNLRRLFGLKSNRGRQTVEAQVEERSHQTKGGP